MDDTDENQPSPYIPHAPLPGAFDDMEHFGWKVNKEKGFDWNTLVEHTQDHIKSVNFGYKVGLRSAKVQYINSFAKFVVQFDPSKSAEPPTIIGICFAS